MTEYFAGGHLRFVNGEWRDDNGDAIEISRVRHGRWEWDTEDIYRCSNCAEKSHVKEVMGHPEWDYCPNCGAKMDGGGGNSAMA